MVGNSSAPSQKAIYKSVCTYVSKCVCVYVSVCMCVYFFVYVSVGNCLCLLCVHVCLCVSCESLCLCVHVSVCLSLSVFLLCKLPVWLHTFPYVDFYS